MPELNQHVGLVGREHAVELVEQLVERDSRKPLPVIVAYGPGGSGKTAFITHLERRYNANTPLAMVQLTQDASKTPQDVLDAIFLRLCRDSQKHFGELRLPRYQTARIIRACAADTVAAPNPHDVIRRRLADQLALSEVGEGIRQGGEIHGGLAGFFARASRPLTRWAYSKAVVAPQPLRRLLAGPKFASAFRWYEREAHKYLRGLAEGVHVDRVGAHIHGRINDEMISKASRDQLNAFMVAALLADLRAEYRRHRARKVNCLVLLDNADLLSPDEAELWAVDGAARKPPQGKDLLKLVGEEMARYPDTPLLIVATKQAAPASDGFDREACHIPESAREHARSWARERYQRWRNGRSGDAVAATSPQLPVTLDPLTLVQTRQLLRELSELGEHTMREEVRVQEVHAATHGHPLAIQLISSKLKLQSNKNSAVPAVRSIFAGLARPEEGDADDHETVRRYLLMRFLQRFRTGPVDDSDLTADASMAPWDAREVRSQTTELLARLAAPMWLDDATVSLLASDRNDEDLRRVKEYVGILSFVETHDDGTWTLHPLLRDLLVPELASVDEESEFSYDKVHRMLAERYVADWNGSQLAINHHLLAVGAVDEVAKRFAERVRRGDPSDQWQADLERICGAPAVEGSQTGQVRAWLQEQGAYLPRAKSSSAVKEVIEALQTLWSCTSAQPWNRRSVNRLDAALAKLPDEVSADWRVRYQRIISDSAPLEVPVLPPVVSPDAVYDYPRVWLGRRGLRVVTASVLALALVGYGVSYGVHVYTHCQSHDLGWSESVWWLSGAPTLDDLDGQCIGASAMPAPFTDPELDGDNERKVAAVRRLIDQENSEVLRRHKTYNEQYFTVVVAAALSSKEMPPRHGLAAGANELRGAFLAQRKWNGFDGKSNSRDNVRLVLANVGGNAQHVARAAGKIRHMAEQDPRIVGVTGLDQTRPDTRNALATLGPEPDSGWPGLPMVASVASGDGLSPMPYFFRVAVPNSRQVDVGMEYLTTEIPDIGERRPWVLYDPKDPYSWDLATNYRSSLESSGNPALRQVGMLPYSTAGAELETNLASHWDQVCAAGEPKPLVIYTGRANEAFPVLSTLGEHVGTCHQDTILFGSDDLSQLENAPFARESLPKFHSGQLRFTSFGADEDDWATMEPELGTQNAVASFFSAHQQEFQETPSNGHVVAAYDSLGVLLRSVDQAIKPERPKPTPADIHNQLRNTTGANVYFGASGVIDFGNRPQLPQQERGDPVDKLVTIQQINKIMGRVETAHAYASGGR